MEIEIHSSSIPLDSSSIEAYDKALLHWFASMDRQARINFYKHTGLRLLTCMLKWELERALLLSMATFWDPNSHVFNFGINELTPTIGEFEAILGIPVSTSIAIPKFSRPIVDALHELLGLDLDKCSSLIHGDKIKLFMLPDLFSNPIGDEAYLKHREGAFALCLMGKFLFYDSPGVVDERVVEVAIQGKDLSHNIMPLVLAETLHGLDKLAHQSCKSLLELGYSPNDMNGLEKEPISMSGSPLLLTIWFREHFILMSPPDDRIYTTITRRERYFKDFSMGEWLETLASKETDEIEWYPAVWEFAHYILRIGDFHCVVLPGLRRSTYYPSLRVLKAIWSCSKALGL